MIIVIRKKNAAMIGLVFVLLLAIYSINKNHADLEPVTNMPESAGETKTYIVVIDAGHGGEDPGAVSDFSGIKEKDINLAIAFKTKQILEQSGYKVVMTRQEDILQYEPGTTKIFYKRVQDLLKRKKLIDESGAQAAVSIHLNKFEQSNIKGAQVFYPHDSPESTMLASSIQKAVKEIADPDNTRQALVKGKKTEKPIILFRDLKIPTVVVECGFLSNAEDEKRLANEAYQDKLALAIAKGIDDYIKQMATKQN